MLFKFFRIDDESGIFKREFHANFLKYKFAHESARES